MQYFIYAFLYSILFIIFLPASIYGEQRIDNKISDTIYHPDRPSNKKNIWRVLPIRSKEEFKKGLIGGEAEQHPHSIARCFSHPEFIYFSHDVSGAWRSTDSGITWQKTLDKGLYANKGQSIEVDPVNPCIVFLESDNAWNWLAKNYKGLYRSSDSGESWKLVLHTETNYNPEIHRIYRHNIAYDITSVNQNGAMRWYAAFPDNGLYRSDNGGLNWTTTPLSSLKNHNIVYCILTHPTDGKTVYIATDKGFYISAAKGLNLKKSGNLPFINISSIAINQKNPLILYITLRGEGLYRSIDGGITFSKIKKFDAARVFINPGHPEIIYLVGLGSNILISQDGGKSWNTNWIKSTKIIPASGLGRDSKWKSKIAGELTGIVPNPKDKSEAVAFSRATVWKTTDCGKTFKDSSTLFTGFAWSWSNSGAAFDIYNKDRFAFFNCDVGMIITHNGGMYFEQRNKDFWDWYNKNLITWLGSYTGAFQPVINSKIIVASIGVEWKTQLIQSIDEGLSWKLFDNIEEESNFFIAFNFKNPNIVYAGNKISHNSGENFTNINFGKFNYLKPSLFGMCYKYPDSVYAIDSKRVTILRSDDACKNWRIYARPGWKFMRMDSRPTFAADPVDPDKIYTLDKYGDLAIFNGKVWKSTGILKLAGGEKVGNFVRTIALDPNINGVIYAGTNASGLSCVWKSIDGAKSWQDITYNLPRTGISTLSVNPHNSELFTGTANGTWILSTKAKK